MTNVFISWSGELSKQLAEELRKWIPAVLQFARPYFTPSDIEKGTKWGSEISQKLAETHVGIICLTRENYQKPWILFEAGALSKDLAGSRICSILFGMDNSDLDGPLTTFQTTMFDKVDFKKLMQSVNDAGGDQKLSRDVFDEVFEMWWPRLEDKVKFIMENKTSGREGELRNDRELLEEILSLSRLSAKRGRSSEADFSPGAISHILKIATGLLNEAQHYRDKDILSAVIEIRDAAGHIARQSGNSGSTREIIEFFDSRVEAVKAVLEGARDLDSEIPF